MHIEEPRHSLLLFISDVQEERLVQEVIGWVRKGIKVWIFAMSPLDKCSQSKEWLQFQQAALLQWWRVPFQPEFDGMRVEFVDGKVTEQALYEYLCSQTSFNREQYEVEHSDPDKHLLVTAGAGTGKTRTLIDRLLFLCHCDPQFSFASTAMITFTNTAALEMRRRLSKRLMSYFEITQNPRYLQWLDEVKDLFLSTIHAFAKSLLERTGLAQGLPDQIRLRSYHELKGRLIEVYIDQFAKQHPEIFQSFQYTPHYQVVRSLRRIMDAVDNHSLTIEELEKLDFGEDNMGFSRLLSFVLPSLYRELERIKEEKGEWELSDLVRKLIRMRKEKEALQDWPIRHIFIDEFQDTDGIQVDLLLWLQQVWNCRLLAVGDVKQSIYRFRGADYTAFQQLREGLYQMNCPVIEKGLVKNYRTIRPLLTEMSSLFKDWGQRITGFSYGLRDQIEGMNDQKGPGLIRKDLTLKTSFRNLLAHLEGTDTCLLVRSNREVDEMVTKLEEWGFFCEGRVEGNFFRSLPVRELYLLISLLTRPLTPALAYAFHHSAYGSQELGNEEIVKEFSPDRKVFLLHWMRLPEVEWLEKMRREMERQPILTLLWKAVREIGPHNRFAQRLYQEWLQRFPERDPETFRKEAIARRLEYEAGLNHLFFLLQREFTDAVATPASVERYLRLQINTNREETFLPLSKERREHRFRCMTVHMAKGAEFDYVILPRTVSPFTGPGLSQVWLERGKDGWQVGYQLKTETTTLSNNHFSTMYYREQEEIRGEETRLLYVAMTRAVKGLYVHMPEGAPQRSQVNRWADLLQEGRQAVVSY